MGINMWQYGLDCQKHGYRRPLFRELICSAGMLRPTNLRLVTSSGGRYQTPITNLEQHLVAKIESAGQQAEAGRRITTVKSDYYLHLR
jgi:hypothetical protein